MLDEINPTTGNYNITDAGHNPEYDNPKKYYQGADVPAGETWTEFWAWWKSLCAEMDSKPKHMVRMERKKDGK